MMITTTCRRPRRVPGRLFAACLLMGSALFAPVGAVAGDCAAFDHQHQPWTELLQDHVRDGVVDYARLHRDDAPLLRRYLDRLEAACADDYATWTRDQKLAFWINAYNAYTLRLILDHYPIDGIRSIGWLPGAAFRREFIPMQKLRGAVLSLQTIEDEILRTELAEPRIHFAVVCASRSCPALASAAYTADALDARLDAAARGFLADSTKNRWNPTTRTLELSAIFQWFKVDFEKAAGTVIAFVGRYVEPSVAAEIREPGVEVRFLPYDWTLNGRAE
jgi:hypothetical protein